MNVIYFVVFILLLLFFLGLVFRNIFGWASVTICHFTLLCNHYNECGLKFVATQPAVPGSWSVRTIEKASGRQAGSAASGIRDPGSVAPSFSTRPCSSPGRISIVYNAREPETGQHNSAKYIRLKMKKVIIVVIIIIIIIIINNYSPKWW